MGPLMRPWTGRVVIEDCLLGQVEHDLGGFGDRASDAGGI